MDAFIILKADLLVSIGRGVGEKENVKVVSELAEKPGGVLSCSRLWSSG